MTRQASNSAFRSLVVEDHPVSRRYITEALRRCGWAVKHCCSAEEALSVFPRWNPRLLITDLNLPGANGLELAEELLRRQRNQDPQTRILLVSADTSAALEQRALQAGLHGVLHKPFDPGKLQLCLEEIACGARIANRSAGRDRTLLKRFHAELRESLPRMETLVLTGNLSGAGWLSHQLTASAAICGCQRLEILARELHANCSMPIEPLRLAATFTEFHRCARSLLEP